MGTNTNAARAMDAARHLVRALAGSSRAVQSTTGITGAQLFVLRQLEGAGRPLSVNELADLTLTHQSTVSGVVARLVERRLVHRAAAADDARRAELSLTARGRALLDGAPATVQSQLVAGLDQLAPAQRAALADALEAWLAAAGLGDGAPPLFFERDEPAPRARPAARAAQPPRDAEAARAPRRRRVNGGGDDA